MDPNAMDSGRSDFDTTEKKDISRWLQGCYFEGDIMKDRGRVLRAKKIAGLI